MSFLLLFMVLPSFPAQQDVAVLLRTVSNGKASLEERLEAFQKVYRTPEVSLEQLLPTYLGVLQDSSQPDEIRTAVVSGLLAVTYRHPEDSTTLRRAVPAFVDCLSSGSVELRSNCALGLHYARPPLPAETFPRIVAAARDSAWQTKTYLVRLLPTAFELLADEIIGTVLELLEADRHPSVLQDALRGIGDAKLYSPRLIPFVVSIAENRRSEIRQDAFWLLGELGSKASDALPALQRISGDSNEDPSIRAAAALAISRISG